MAAIFRTASHEHSETMFDNKVLADLYEDATYLYEAKVKEKDKLSWFEKKGKWYPVIHKSSCIQGVIRTFAFFIVAQKAEGELASKAALAWAYRVKQIDNTTKIAITTMFEHAKNAFIELEKTYNDQYKKSSNIADFNAASNYSNATEIMRNILT